MTERVPPPTDEARILDDPPTPERLSPEGNFDSRSPATYVVQVPKDQIYRVPPPENAAIAERHRKQRRPAPDHAAKPGPARYPPCCFAVFTLSAIAIALALAAGFLYLSASLRPELPVFGVERVAAVESRGRAASYEVTLRADNLNPRLDMWYGQPGGVVSLRVEEKEVAAGKFPAFHHEHGSSAVLKIVLRGKSTVDKKAARARVRLEMSNLAARTEVWTCNTGTVEFDVACDVTVDSLTPKDHSARVLSQECRTTTRD